MAPSFCYALSALIGYLFGCVNPAALIARRKGVDYRKNGSGNPGASNMMVLFGWKYGILAAAVDIGKTVLAVLICTRLFPALPLCRETAGAACVLGHMFPVTLRFRGGKGFASSFGMIAALNWRFALGLGVCALVLVLITDYIVAGTVATAVSYPAYCFMTHQLAAALILSAVACVILYKHRANFARILNGTEMRVRRANRGDYRLRK